MRFRQLSRKRFPGAGVITAVLLTVSFFPLPSVRGESTDFELFAPAPAPESGFVSESPRLMEQVWTAGTYIQYEKKPVLMPGSVQEYDEMVYHRSQMHLIFSYNLLRKALVSVDFPFTLSSDQEIAGGRQSGAFANDLVLKGRYPIRRWGSFHLGVSGALRMSSGKAEVLGGTDGRFLQPAVMFLGEYDRSRWFVRANLGYEERDDTDLGEYDIEDIEIADRVLTRVSGGYRVSPDLVPFVELAGSHQVRDTAGAYDHNVLELFLGVEKRLGDFVAAPGMAFGLTEAFGVPSWRLICSLFYLPEAGGGFIMGQGEGDLVKVSLRILDSLTNEPVRKGEITVKRKKSRFSRGGWEAEVPPGTYRIRAAAKGYKSAGRRVVLKAGRPQSSVVKLTPILPTISAKVVDYKTKKPIGKGNVYIHEAKYQGNFTRGKWKRTFSPGKHRIVFTAVGYHPKSKKISVDLGDEETIVVKLTPKVKGVKVVVTENEVYINEKIHFEAGSAKIKSESYPLLDSVAEILIESPELKKFLIKGHCDSTGGFEANVKLSHQRAHAVRDYLVGKGVDPGRLESRGYGSSQPIADNSTPEGMEENRRVEFEILEIGP